MSTRSPACGAPRPMRWNAIISWPGRTEDRRKSRICIFYVKFITQERPFCASETRRNIASPGGSSLSPASDGKRDQPEAELAGGQGLSQLRIALKQPGDLDPLFGHALFDLELADDEGPQGRAGPLPSQGLSASAPPTPLWPSCRASDYAESKISRTLPGTAVSASFDRPRGIIRDSA
jgi:hypothetical protein